MDRFLTLEINSIYQNPPHRFRFKTFQNGADLLNKENSKFYDGNIQHFGDGGHGVRYVLPDDAVVVAHAALRDFLHQLEHGRIHFHVDHRAARVARRGQRLAAQQEQAVLAVDVREPGGRHRAALERASRRPTHRADWARRCRNARTSRCSPTRRC